MTFWFGFLAIWSAVGITAALIALLAGQWKGLFFVVLPILTFGFGIGSVKSACGLSLRDRRLKAETLADALGGSILAET